MNDEIKEILEELENMYEISELEEQVNNINKIRDYITNLQQENERLKELCNKYEEEHNNEFKIWKEERHELLDYKSRCEKAIEYVNENKHLSMFADCREPEEDWNYDLECSANDLLNILQNGSENDEKSND